MFKVKRVSRLEAKMIDWFWEQGGGTLIEDFQIMPESAGQDRNLIATVIIPDEPKQRMTMTVGTSFNLEGRDVLVVRTKNRHLNMSIILQTAFLVQLIKRFRNPHKVQPVILCTIKNHILESMLKANGGCRVVVCPPEIGS